MEKKLEGIRVLPESKHGTYKEARTIAQVNHSTDVPRGEIAIE